MHAARLVAAESALLALLVEANGEQEPEIDGLTASLTFHPTAGPGLDLVYTSKGRPVAGEGM